MTTDEMVADLETAVGELALTGADDVLIDAVDAALNTRTDEAVRDAYAAIERWREEEGLHGGTR